MNLPTSFIERQKICRSQHERTGKTATSYTEDCSSYWISFRFIRIIIHLYQSSQRGRTGGVMRLWLSMVRGPPCTVDRPRLRAIVHRGINLEVSSQRHKRLQAISSWEEKPLCGSGNLSCSLCTNRAEAQDSSLGLYVHYPLWEVLYRTWFFYRSCKNNSRVRVRVFCQRGRFRLYCPQFIVMNGLQTGCMVQCSLYGGVGEKIVFAFYIHLGC